MIVTDIFLPGPKQYEEVRSLQNFEFLVRGQFLHKQGAFQFSAIFHLLVINPFVHGVSNPGNIWEGGTKDPKQSFCFSGFVYAS